MELVGPSNLWIRVSCVPNYITAISDKIACWEGEQFLLSSTTCRPIKLELKSFQNDGILFVSTCPPKSNDIRYAIIFTKISNLKNLMMLENC